MAKLIKCGVCREQIPWDSSKCMWCGSKCHFKIKLILGIVAFIFVGIPIIFAIVLPALLSETPMVYLCSALVPIALVAGLIWLMIRSNKRREAENFIICHNANCGYRGPGKQVGASNGCLLLLLFICGILPAILYILFCGKKELICPKCGCKIR